MEYVILAAVIAGFVINGGRIWLIRRRGRPLRREVRAQDVTFRVGLNVLKKRDPGDLVLPWGSITAPTALYVRGDAIEISGTWALFRALGLEYYFKACEASIEMSRSPSRLSQKNWIVVTGHQLGKEVQLAIGNNNDRRFPEIWNALVEAGATPVGLPPQEKPAGAWGVP